MAAWTYANCFTQKIFAFSSSSDIDASEIWIKTRAMAKVESVMNDIEFKQNN